MPQGNTKYLENKELLKNPKVQAMLKVISTAEGATYNTRVGGAKFDDLSKKPGKAVYIPSIKQYSSAEGRFQFLNKTWEGVSKDLGLKDFSPESQDIAAVELIKRRGALNDILNDNFDIAINKLSPEWASLPTASGKGYYAGQKAKKIDKLRSIYFGSRDQPTPTQTLQQTSEYEEFTPYLATNTGAQETAGEYKEPKEVSQAKQELIQAQNEENFIKEVQSSLQPQQIISQQPNYLQSQELFTLAPVEEIQYIQQPDFKTEGLQYAQRGGKIELKDSKIEGKGIFSTERLKKGEFIGLAHSNGQPSTELGRFHNHSENPNSESVLIGDNRYILTKAPIKKGEEITVDYRQQPELEQPEDFKNISQVIKKKRFSK